MEGRINTWNLMRKYCNFLKKSFEFSVRNAGKSSEEKLRVSCREAFQLLKGGEASSYFSFPAGKFPILRSKASEDRTGDVTSGRRFDRSIDRSIDRRTRRRRRAAELRERERRVDRETGRQAEISLRESFFLYIYIFSFFLVITTNY